MKWHWSNLVFLGLAVAAYADIGGRLNIRSQDGTVNTYPYSAKFTNGALTDNNDGTVSISASGGTGASLSADNVFTGTNTFNTVILSSYPVMTASRSDTINFPSGKVQATPYHPSSEFFTHVDENVILNNDVNAQFTKGAAGTLSWDASDFIRGSGGQSLKLGSDGAATAVVAKRINIAPTIDFTNKQLVLYLKISGFSNMAEGSLYLSSDNLAANYYVFDWAAPGSAEEYVYWQEGEWTRITLNFGEATVTGSPDRSAINSIQLRIKDKGVSGSTVTVRWNGIATIPQPLQGVVSITDDDGFSAVVSTMAQYMDKYGYRGTAYIEPDNQFGSSNFMSSATIVQLEQLHGWEIGLHPTVSRLPNLSTGTIDYTYYVNKIWMVQEGIARYMDGMVYPHGGFNQTVEGETRKYFTYARTIVTGPSNTNPYLETIPPANPYRLRSISVSSTTTGNQMYLWAQRAATNHEWLILTFHDFPVPQVAATDISPSTFQTFIDTVAALGLRVEPVGEVMRHINGTNVAGPTVATAVSYTGLAKQAAAYTITSTDTVVLASCPANTSLTFTLPSAASNRGQQLFVTKVDVSTQSVTVQAAGSDLINSTTGQVVMYAPGQGVKLISDGTSNWVAPEGLPYTPSFLGPYADPQSAAALSTSSAAYTVPWTVTQPVAVTGMRFNVGSQSGNMDVGIYDSKGRLVVSNGGTAVPGVNQQNLNFSSVAYLQPGQYFLAMTASNTTATFTRIGPNSPTGLWAFGGVNYPLPASLTFPGTAATRSFFLQGLVAGGISQ